MLENKTQHNKQFTQRTIRTIPFQRPFNTQVLQNLLKYKRSRIAGLTPGKSNMDGSHNELNHKK